ncbi:MAG: hypothetical protein DRQ55_04275 [Planctomycetota bacterium]|nr:MAG: hypothetical protein DRQ55_04275 [Planctomycetota bacterium]
MGLFGRKQAEQVRVVGVDLHCEICKHERFFSRDAQLNTAVMSFFDMDWANKTATCFVCERCGYVHWFLPTG